MPKDNNQRRRRLRVTFLSISLMICWSLISSGCVGRESVKSEEIEEEGIALGLIEVEATGEYSRGYQTQLRFFHLLNISTQERIRVDVQAGTKAFVLSFTPGDYEVTRVQINEGPFMMESHLTLRFQVSPNGVTYLGTWRFEVDSPRTQRMVRMEIAQEPPNWDEISEMHPFLKDKALVVSLPDPPSHQARLYAVAPYPRARYYHRR